MVVENNRIIKPVLYEVIQENIEEANEMAEMLMQSHEPRATIIIIESDGQEVSGYLFEDVFVTNDFIAIVGDSGEIDRFLPRR